MALRSDILLQTMPAVKRLRMSFARSAQQYFHQPPVHKLLQRLAQQDSLVIYAGAGASIDRTGLSWRGLVVRLLEAHIDDERERQFLMDSFSPVEAASIACEMALERHGQNKDNYIRDEVRKLLYAEQVWQRGNLMTALVELAARFASLNKETHIITTNYDDSLEKEFKILERAAVGSPIQFPKFVSRVVKHGRRRTRKFDLDKEVAKYTVSNSLVYVHGRIPQAASSGVESPVLGEVDYIDSQRLTSAILVELFKNKSVVVVGSSLTDPPLLDALAKTRRDENEKRAGKRLRVAVMPLQGITFPKSLPEGEEGERLIEHYWRKAAIRMRQFDIEGTFPDFYSQVAQFLTEVRVCADLNGDRESYHSSGKRYGMRLVDWWDQWYTSRRGGAGVDPVTGDQNFVERQGVDHATLLSTLGEISRILGVDDVEKMKIEIWLRWAPKNNRKLKIWASSTGTWPDVDITHSAEIEANSTYASVRAFCLGRPQIYDNEDKSRRWLTHLCAPLIINDENKYGTPVGVISLASMLPSADKNSAGISKIGSWNGRLVEEVVEKLKEVGLSMVAV